MIIERAGAKVDRLVTDITECINTSYPYALRWTRSYHIRLLSMATIYVTYR